MVTERLNKLVVRSQMLDWLMSASSSGNRSDLTRQSCPKRRRVHPTQAALSDEEVVSTPNEQRDPQLCSDDSCLQNICSILNELSRQQSEDLQGRFLGYIDSLSDDGFRHSFYQDNRPRDMEEALRKSPTTEAQMSMSDILSHPAERSLGIVDQLKLARNLAFAVLQFHSTPWLRDYFSLRDLSFFKAGHALPKWLETLHVTLDFVQPLVENDAQIRPEASQAGGLDPSVTELAKFQFGVRNLTLWSLGTCLFQIGQWSGLRNVDDIPGVRKAAEQSHLGPRYRDLTKKCLECDFGNGDDLTKPRLQQAVYEGLVCELTDMIRGLGVDDETEAE